MEHRVVLGDCLGPEGLATLADKSVDCVITDPPYSEHTHTNSVRGHGHRPGGKLLDLGFECMTTETARAVAVEIARVVRRWALVFSDVESSHIWRQALTDAGLEYVRAGVWVKENPTPQMTGDRPAIGVELITIAHPKGRKHWHGGGKPAVWTNATAYRDGDEIVHTTQKPLGLMEALVRDFTDPGETILDPFAGSGTTAIACKRLGRGFIGWELDMTYAAIAEKRIAGTREQLGLLRPAYVEPKPIDLFPRSSPEFVSGEGAA